MIWVRYFFTRFCSSKELDPSISLVIIQCTVALIKAAVLRGDCGKRCSGSFVMLVRISFGLQSIVLFPFIQTVFIVASKVSILDCDIVTTKVLSAWENIFHVV